MAKKKPQSLVDAVIADAKLTEGHAKIEQLERSLRKSQNELSDATRNLRIARDDIARMESRIELAEATYRPTMRYEIGASSRKGKKSAPCSALVMMSDLHLEERVDPDVCSGNEYNLEIAKRRNDRVISTMVDSLSSQRNFYPWSDLVIWLGGDMISGAIHEELQAQNFLGPTDAIMFAQDMMLANIQFLMKSLEPKSTTVICNMGNHGRTTKRKRYADGYEHSWEYLAYHNMARSMQADKSVKFIIAKGSIVEVEIETVPVRFTHGDDIRYEGGVGGVFIPLAKKIANWDRSRKVQKTILGHFHQHFHIPAAIMNGCLIGANAYSVANGFEAHRPSQTTAIVDRDRGFVDVTQIFAE